MDYMKNFFNMQKGMFDSFQESYSKMFDSEGKNPYQKGFEDLIEMQKNMMSGWDSETNPFAFYKKMMDMQKEYPEAFKAFYDMQEVYFENMGKMGDFYSKGFNAFDFQNYDFSNIHEAFDKYKDFYSNYDFFRALDPNMSEVAKRMFDANKFYLQMYEFWKSLNDEFLKDMDLDSEKFKNFIEESANITYDTFTSVLPGEVAFLFGGMKDLAARYFDTMSNFYSPWKGEIDKLRDLFMEGILGGEPEKMADFFRLWREKYDETFGKIVTSPAMGISREQVEQQKKMVDTFINMYVKSAEFSTNLNAVQNTAFKNIIEEYKVAVKEGLEIKTFEEFYDFWSKRMDQHLEQHFGTEEFAKMLGQFSEAFMDFRIEYNKAVEFYFAESPIVTEGKLDSMIKSIYDLKKEVRALKKEVASLKADASAKAESVEKDTK